MTENDEFISELTQLFRKFAREGIIFKEKKDGILVKSGDHPWFLVVLAEDQSYTWTKTRPDLQGHRNLFRCHDWDLVEKDLFVILNRCVQVYGDFLFNSSSITLSIISDTEIQTKI